MKAPSDEMAMRPLTEGTKRRTGLEKRLAWELERWAQALVLSDPVPTLRKTRPEVYASTRHVLPLALQGACSAHTRKSLPSS